MSEHIDGLESISHAIFVARQPIFDNVGGIWGYELLFRSGEVGVAEIEDPDLATARVIADGISLGTCGVAPGAMFLINFPSKMIIDNSALAMAKESCIVEILETVEPTPELIRALIHIKSQGYTLAFDDFIGQEGFEEILKLADIVKVEVLGMTPSQLIVITQRLRKYGVRLLAEKIEDKATFNLCKSLGYEYFQGYYFCKPELVEGRKIPIGQIARLALLQKITTLDYDVNDLANTIRSDTSLSYRLLVYLNSASFGLRAKVSSLAQAVTILGHRSLKHWLMVVIVADMAPSARASELVFRSVQRGRFLELLAQSQHVKAPLPANTLFLLGLFSQLDALLSRPMSEIIDQMSLIDDLEQALLGKSGLARDWLDMAEAVEFGVWSRVKALLSQCGMHAEEAAQQYTAAMAWTSEIFQAAKMPEQAGSA